jgi:membrane protein DedA with SNARE-associated domain
MNTTYRVLLMVLGGVLGGYAGYWLGHLAGWSTGAVWPFTIGGGAGAIATSILLAVVGVLVVAWLTRRWSPRRRAH